MSDEAKSRDNVVDREFSGQHGATASKSTLESEAHPEVNPQSFGELGGKIKAEASEGDGIIDKAKRALKEIDRDVSGEYEARSEDEAAGR